jgi:hypothetical protein
MSPPATATPTRSNSRSKWSCDRCEVTIKWMDGHERTGPPAGWTRRGDKAHCLHCRRAIAAEAANETAPEGASREERAKLRAQALIEFEIRRDPDRPNGEIAKVVRCSVPAVMKARTRIEAEPKAPSGAKAKKRR